MLVWLETYLGTTWPPPFCLEPLAKTMADFLLINSCVLNPQGCVLLPTAFLISTTSLVPRCPGWRPRHTAESGTLTWPPSSTLRTWTGWWTQLRTPLEVLRARPGSGCMITSPAGDGHFQTAVTTETKGLTTGTGILVSLTTSSGTRCVWRCGVEGCGMTRSAGWETLSSATTVWVCIW